MGQELGQEIRRLDGVRIARGRRYTRYRDGTHRGTWSVPIRGKLRAVPLSEAAFTELVDAGCPACATKRLVVESYVAQRLPLMAGEVFGKTSWGYKGEDLVRGVFRIACTGCAHEIHASAACAHCAALDGLERALEAENDFPLPVTCGGCGGELLTATAYVPATVVYEGKRAAPARTQTAPEDPGFHAFRVECKSCRNTSERTRPCPLCGDPGATLSS